MNKGLLALNGVLVVAVIALFYMQLSSKPKTSNVAVSNDINEVISDTKDSIAQFLNLDSNISAKPIKIAYVNSDSLDKNLKMLVDINEELKKKEEEISNKIIAEKNRYENKYKGKIQSFDSKRKGYAAKAPTMTDAQLQAGEQELMGLQQEIAGLEQTYSQELMIFQQKLEQEFRMFQSDKMTIYYGKVKEFCETMASSLGFDFILMYQEGGSIIFANKAFDISKYIIEGINKEYDATKIKTKK